MTEDRHDRHAKPLNLAVFVDLSLLKLFLWRSSRYLAEGRQV